MPPAARCDARTACAKAATAYRALPGTGRTLRPHAVTVLGCRVDAIDAATATRQIFRLVHAGRGAQIVTLGTEMVVYAQRDARYRDVINKSALSLCDTAGLLAAARFRGADLRRRVTGVDLIEGLCASAARENSGVFFLGGKPGVADKAAAALRRRHAGLRVAGTADGYFAEAESSAIAARIRASGAGLLLAGLGFPRQEFWLAEHLHESGCGAGMGVGGSFDVLSGAVPRAPHAWRSAHLEWLYRLLKEPRRWRRQLALPHFVLLVAGECLRASIAKDRPRA